MPRRKRPSEMIAPDEYDARLRAQDGRCAICGCEPTGRRLDIDHDHRSGRVRGLLCSRCNRALPSEVLLPPGMTLKAWLLDAAAYVHEGTVRHTVAFGTETLELVAAK